jgi:hypothetical protein
MVGYGSVRKAVGAMDFPRMDMVGTGLVGQIGRGKMEIPLFIMSGQSGALAAMQFPKMEMAGHGLVGQVGTGRLFFSVPVMDGRSGALAAMQFTKMEMAGHGLVGQVGMGKLLFSVPVMDGKGYSSIIGRGAMLFSPMVMTGGGKVSVIGQGKMGFSLPVVNGHGYAGIVGNGQMIFPLPVLAGKGFVEIFGRGAMDFPLPQMIGAGRIIPVTILYKGVAMNASHFAITEYKDFPFNSFACFNGVYLGANSEGIFALEGNNDNGKKIDSFVELPPVDFGAGFIKRARDAWLTYRADGQLVLVLRLDEHETWESALQLPKGRSHEERVKIARGIKNRFIGFGIKNEMGCDFDIESLRVLVEPVQRRTR